MKKSSQILQLLFCGLVLAAFPGIQNEVAAQQIIAKAGAVTGENERNDPYRSEFFRVRGAPTINIHTISGDIEVIQNSALQGVQIDIYAKQSFSLWSGTRSLDNYRVILQQKGDNIIASVEDKRSSRNYRSDSGVRFSFVIQVPKESSLNLRTAEGKIIASGIVGKQFVQNHSGSIQLSDIQGELRAASTTGTIEIENSSGTIFSKTVGGDLFVRESSGEIRLRTVSGSIYTTGISGTLVAASTSGDIESGFYNISDGVYLETTSGDVELQIPKGPGYSITAEAMRFNFDELEGMNSDKSVRFRNASVTVRDGEIPVNIKTVAGTVTVRDSR